MTPENQKKYDEKLKRLNDAMELREPDRVPIAIEGGKFMINQAGYTMREAIYDESMQVFKEAAVKFMKDFDPDVVPKSAAYFFGEGVGHELSRPKTMLVAGMQNDVLKVDEDSIHQHIEYPMLLDDEFEEFFSDRTGWRLHKYLPRNSGVFEGFEHLEFNFDNRASINIAMELTRPEVQEAIATLTKIGEYYRKQRKTFGGICRELIDMGYPDLSGGGAAVVPFDNYSDNYRGTIKSLEDLYEREDDVLRYIEEFHAQQLKKIRGLNKDGSKTGLYISSMLHKGVDGFMSDEYYEKFYWRHMKEIMQAEIDVGLVPMMFCEGKYNTRLKYLHDSPKGKIVYRFESIDMELAKKELSGVACVCGGFPSALLLYATPEKVAEECKRFLEKAMPGGGYIFRTSSGLDGAKPENVEAMFQTVREYGRYR